MIFIYSIIILIMLIYHVLILSPMQFLVFLRAFKSFLSFICFLILSFLSVSFSCFSLLLEASLKCVVVPAYLRSHWKSLLTDGPHCGDLGLSLWILSLPWLLKTTGFLVPVPVASWLCFLCSSMSPAIPLSSQVIFHTLKITCCLSCVVCNLWKEGERK